ncbi:MAG: hypothetical protein U9R32_04265 [Bacteroidota bacterium]|nr:hypothetical protein [Bacteroidota bacterium]
MEDYIVLILGLIWGGVTLYKKSLGKSANTLTDKKGDAKPKKSLFEEFFEEKFAEHNYSDEFRDDSNVKEETFSGENKPENDYNNIINRQQKRKENDEIINKRLKSNLKLYEEEQDYEEEHWFNLRDAVVYSEIMNKPDY